MGKCTHCGQILPAEVPDAVFCVWCGETVAQECPYRCSGVPIPIAESSGRLRSSCPNCGMPFKSCERCRCLYSLESEVCQRCGEDLVEPAVPYESERGPLNGTRLVQWATHLGSRMKSDAVLSAERGLSKLVYRYGLLLGLTPSSLLGYSWDGSNWYRKFHVSLPVAPGFKPKSLVVGNGCAFVAGDQKSVAVSLVGESVAQAFDGPAAAQAIIRSAPDYYWLLLREKPNGRSELLAVNTADWTERSVDLELAASRVADVACGGQMYVAARDSGVWSFDVVAERFSCLDEMAGNDCVRLACIDGRVVVLGYDMSRRPTVWQSEAGDGCFVARPLEGEPVLEFCVVDRWLFVAEDGRIMRFNLDSLAAVPKPVDLPRGDKVKPFMLAPRDEGGALLLLVKSSSQGRVYLRLVDPEAGKQIQVAAATSDPVVCVADDKLVVASLENSGMKLRTYVFED